ncbi:glycosyl hydrolase family 28-related protein [Burkholderia sp. BCC0044]|uniref:glycosyl hydrolase family 28-related protein n=1 Tax=Burkholderia sp. BCC0044 TaxID=2676295 RepID=UPI00158DE860|nr:glycosyl hydrolase family 28-related protein [Burkholderia sp. BCC0044]
MFRLHRVAATRIFQNGERKREFDTGKYHQTIVIAWILGFVLAGGSCPVPAYAAAPSSHPENGANTTRFDSARLFRLPASDSVPRTIADKLSDSDSVFDFMSPAQIADVKAGTASIDVSKAIQGCIDYQASKQRGGTCDLPSGVYLIKSTLREARSHVRLRGAGKSATVIATSTDIVDILVGTNPVTPLVGNDIIDIGFFHTDAAVKTKPHVILLSPIQSTIRASFTNGAFGVFLYGGQGVKLDQIVAPGNYDPEAGATRNSHTAISLLPLSAASGYKTSTGAVELPTEVEISSPYINGPLLKGWQYGISIFAGEHVTLDGTYYIGQSTVDNVHIEQRADNKLILEPTLAPGGYIDGAGRAGVWVGGPSANGSQYIGQLAIYSTIKGQSGSGLDGIVIDGTNRGGAYSQAVINATLSPVQVSGWRRHGINLAGGQNINIPSPNIFGNSFLKAGEGNGIDIGQHAAGVRISGGRVGGDAYGRGTGNQAQGIAISPSSKNVTVAAVDLNGNQSPTNGIANAEVSDNQITDSPGFSGNRGAISPQFPASGKEFKNPLGSRALVSIRGGKIASIDLNGHLLFNSAPDAPFSIAPSDTLRIIYSSRPDWTWWPQ